MPAPPTDDEYSAFVQTALARTYAAWRNVRSFEAAGGYARTTLLNTATSWFRKPSWRRELAHETLLLHGPYVVDWRAAWAEPLGVEA